MEFENLIERLQQSSAELGIAITEAGERLRRGGGTPNRLLADQGLAKAEAIYGSAVGSLNAAYRLRHILSELPLQLLVELHRVEASVRSAELGDRQMQERLLATFNTDFVSADVSTDDDFTLQSSGAAEGWRTDQIEEIEESIEAIQSKAIYVRGLSQELDTYLEAHGTSQSSSRLSSACNSSERDRSSLEIVPDSDRFDIRFGERISIAVSAGGPIETEIVGNAGPKDVLVSSTDSVNPVIQIAPTNPNITDFQLIIRDPENRQSRVVAFSVEPEDRPDAGSVGGHDRLVNDLISRVEAEGAMFPLRRINEGGDALIALGEIYGGKDYFEEDMEFLRSEGLVTCSNYDAVRTCEVTVDGKLVLLNSN
ncbi:MAG: hypothetical protein AAF384_09950 [Pseudomonadota bacterium]